MLPFLSDEHECVNSLSELKQQKQRTEHHWENQLRKFFAMYAGTIKRTRKPVGVILDLGHFPQK